MIFSFVICNEHIKCLDLLISKWTSVFGSINIHQMFTVIVGQICTACKRSFWTIPLYKTFQVIFLSFWGHCRESQSGWGQGSKWTLQKVYFLLLKSFYCLFSHGLWIIVVLRCPTSVEVQLVNKRSYILIQNVLINLKKEKSHPSRLYRP